MFATSQISSVTSGRSQSSCIWRCPGQVTFVTRGNSAVIQLRPKAKTPICWNSRRSTPSKLCSLFSPQLTFTEAMRNKARLSITGSVGENGRVLTPDCPKAVHAGPPLHQSSGLALVSSELPWKPKLSQVPFSRNQGGKTGMTQQQSQKPDSIGSPQLGQTGLKGQKGLWLITAQRALRNLREQHISKLDGSADAWIKGSPPGDFNLSSDGRISRRKEKKT